MSEIPKAYEPQAVEDKWYQFWIDQNCFTADPKSAKPGYSIVIPPPNVTGMLHMGHVLNNTIQDILSRKARMDGKEVLWLPGTDHAGIATQMQVEKALKKEEKKTKYDLGREEFLKRVWQWKEKHGGIIIKQLQKLGASCDWSRLRFTMDPEYSRCVQQVFVELYKKGLIYRGKRMVNWCPVSQTALSDEEVEMKAQKGFMYHFKVQVAEAPETWLTIATTRPETIPGDTAVAVNPKDPRYAHLIGKHIIRPLPIELSAAQKLIPIIGDEHVDFEFGTGVLKVTPAHDKADFEIGQRHKLPLIDIMNADATMNDLAGTDLKGMDRFKARKLAVEKLGELGVMVEEKPYENNVGFSQRADVPIEPRLSEQWFLKYPSVSESKACVADGRMKFYPDRWAKVYDYWLTNIQDWCISRQLWWGHQIPVWTLKAEMTERKAAERIIATLLLVMIHGITKEEAEQFVLSINGKIYSYEQIEKLQQSGSEVVQKTQASICTFSSSSAIATYFPNHGFIQDPDVLDTWFSSWLWPFATMGWPEKTEELKKFYPTTDLVTGPDIIFFWVARMIMAGYEYMGELPFHNVYFTGIIRDKQGRKMSKTLGNSPDPLELIAKYGADALRFGTMRGAPLGQDVLFDEKDVELGRNFCNKLWNACRFRQMHPGEVEGEINPQLLTSDDKWILLKLDQAIRELTTALAEYRFNEAAQMLYRFFWSEFCDWYLETAKVTFYGEDAARKANVLAVMDFVLGNTLRLFHPFMPFITEELWHGLGYHQELPEGQGGKTIMYANWPKPLDDDFRGHYGLDDCYVTMVEDRNAFVIQGRNLRQQGNIQAAKKVKFVFKPSTHVGPHDLAAMKLLLNAEALDVNADYQPPKGTPSTRSELGELFLPLEGLIDVEAEKVRLTKKIADTQLEIQKVEQKLNNPAFVQKVPQTVLDEHQKRLTDWQATLAQLKSSLDALQG